MTKCPSVCTSHCVFTPCIMKVNNAFDTNLMLLALDVFLQTGGVKAKLQVVFLRRNVFVCDWQQNSRDLSRHRPLHPADRQVEVRKQTAGLPGALGRGQRQRGRSSCRRAWGEESPSRTKREMLVFSLKEPNSSVIGISYKKRATEKWQELQSWPEGSPPPAFLGSYSKARSKWVVVSWQLKGGYPRTPKYAGAGSTESWTLVFPKVFLKEEICTWDHSNVWFYPSEQQSGTGKSILTGEISRSGLFFSSTLVWII